MRLGVLPCMPRYFFHLYNDIVALDDEGRELPDIEAARRIAECEARTMASAQVCDGKLGLSHRIDVTDEHDQCVATVRFRDVVDVQE